MIGWAWDMFIINLHRIIMENGKSWSPNTRSLWKWQWACTSTLVLLLLLLFLFLLLLDSVILMVSFSVHFLVYRCSSTIGVLRWWYCWMLAVFIVASCEFLVVNNAILNPVLIYISSFWMESVLLTNYSQLSMHRIYYLSIFCCLFDYFLESW